MNQCIRNLAAMSALAAVASHAHTAPQRWNVDILGLRAEYIDVYDEQYNVQKSIDVHGYFIGEDLDRDGALSRHEFHEVSLPGIAIGHYLPSNDYLDVTALSYSPDQGLQYQGSDSYPYATWIFGERADLYARFGSNHFVWTSTTVTRITAVPEASAIGMGMVGLAVASLLMRRRARRITA